MLSPNIETFLGCEADFAEARIVLFGAPFDSTTSYRPGTRFASKVMRAESYGLETYSPYQDLDMEDAKVFDSGDLELSFGNTEQALADIEARAAEILAANKLPFLIGGEHLVSLGAIRAVHNKYPDLHILHFDAHTDLREEYLGARLSHASVIRRAWELVGDDKIWQLGIRSGMKEEFQWAKEHTHLYKFDLKALPQALATLKDKPVYFTIDLDVMDPSVFPGTGTPEYGGVSFKELMEAAVAGCGLNIVGCDIVELAPTLDNSGASTAAALKILREMLLKLEEPFISGPESV
ncbi:MAG: agmatinase [Anaerovibrio sp.]|uniref:agmatinase n=1 Tax=Anaerovibrio sp. TaxID=1872532 RepID=UPI0025C06A2E|nr:agmatinase [Anaerovibrio sp.]MBE6100110.1 agmatinase [Anaerovibrio sp.]